MSHVEKQLPILLLSHLGNDLLHSRLAARGVHWLTDGCIRSWGQGKHSIIASQLAFQYGTIIGTLHAKVD